jgi:hypothetical protein
MYTKTAFAMLILFVAFGLSLAHARAELKNATIAPSLPSKPERVYSVTPTNASVGFLTKTFSIGGTNYVASIWNDNDSSWQPSSPWPIDFATAEQLARKKLQKFIQDDRLWQISDFGIRRFENNNGWYFALTLTGPAVTAAPSDSFTMLFTTAGRPGRIEPAPTQGAKLSSLRFYKRGMEAFQKGSFLEAETLLAAAVHADPTNTEAQLALISVEEKALVTQSRNSPASTAISRLWYPTTPPRPAD